MKRDPSKLARDEYDLVVVGAGIYGICAARDAALRGLSVALIERGDFCAETSANPIKIVHGGFRYIQHADIARIRESTRERNIFLRNAPHLIQPLPFLIPTYGRGMQGREVLTAGLLAYDFFAFDRNRKIEDPQKKIPWGKLISRDECLRRFPQVSSEKLTGALVFYDGQMYSPPRLAVCYLKSAVRAGADAVNYTEVVDFLREDKRVTGVRARDRFTGTEFDVRGRMVVNTTGPWIEKVLQRLDLKLPNPLQVTKDLYLVVRRVLDERYALAAPSRYSDPEAILSRGHRHFFFIPWRNHTLIGSSHALYEGHPDQFAVTDEDVQQLIEEVNEAYPIGIQRSDVTFWNSGMVTFGDHYGHRSRIIDHAKVDGVDGLITIVGVRWTTSRGVAAKAVNLVSKALGKKTESTTAVTPVYGGDIDRFDAFLGEAIERHGSQLDAESVRSLVHNHGSSYPEVLRYVEEDPATARTLGDSPVIGAEVVHAVRHEMALKLGDVVFRRTDLGTAGSPGGDALRQCAALMAGELGWDEERVEREIAEVQQVFP